MNTRDDSEDPFKLQDLWQTSSFALAALPPLESAHFESAIAGSELLSAFNLTITDDARFRHSQRPVQLPAT